MTRFRSGCYHAGVLEGESFLRRVGVIGDVHAEDADLEAVLNFLREQGDLDALLCTGDIVDGEGDASRCCALLREAGALTVRGNHDRWLFEMRRYESVDLSARAYLAALPPTRRFQTPRGPLLLCHGLGDNDITRWSGYPGVYPDDGESALQANLPLLRLLMQAQYRFVINGHTHRRMVRTLDDLTILNAGTLQWGYERGFLIADFERAIARFYTIAADGPEITPAEAHPLP